MRNSTLIPSYFIKRAGEMTHWLRVIKWLLLPRNCLNPSHMVAQTSYLQAQNICSSLNENGSQKFPYLNAWSPIDGTAWEGWGSVALLEEVWHWPVGFESSKAHTIPCVCSPSLPSTTGLGLKLVGQHVSSQILLQHHAPRSWWGTVSLQ